MKSTKQLTVPQETRLHYHSRNASKDLFKIPTLARENSLINIHSDIQKRRLVLGNKKSEVNNPKNNLDIEDKVEQINYKEEFEQTIMDSPKSNSSNNKSEQICNLVIDIDNDDFDNQQDNLEKDIEIVQDSNKDDIFMNVLLNDT